MNRSIYPLLTFVLCLSSGLAYSYLFGTPRTAATPEVNATVRPSAEFRSCQVKQVTQNGRIVWTPC